MRLEPYLSDKRVQLAFFSSMMILVLLLSSVRVFGAVPPTLTASPNTFGNGATVMVSGSGFTQGTSIKVWFDTNGNGKLDNGEPEASVTVGSGGTFSGVPLLITGVADGGYFIDSGPSSNAIASTPVTVYDPTILSGLSADLAQLQSELESNLATQLANLQSNILGAISSFQSDVDSRLNGIQSSLTNLQNTVNSLPSSSDVQQSYSIAHATCTLNPDNNFYGGNSYGCGSFHITGNTWPEAVFTITMSIESTGLEAGATVYIQTDSAKIDAAHCDVGTCGLDGFTTTVASAGVSIWASCGGPTDSCDTPIVIDYSIVATASANGQSLTCTTYNYLQFC